MSESKTDGSRSETMRWQPLKDVRVVDFSLLLPGPFATLFLADLGADVIKVEPPGGDFARRMPVAMFRMANRNKRSITLDLKQPEAKSIVERLARWGDVAIEGYRPGVADRLGIGYAALSAINPRIIFCSLSGYGGSGPDTMSPGHDANYLAAGGVMALPGHWGEPPRRTGVPIADLAGGSYAAIAILSAMHERQHTGRGVQLDLSLTEVSLSMAAIRHGLDLDERSQNHLYPTNDIFATKDGRGIAFGIVEQHFWDAFAASVAQIAPDLSDPRYADEPSRRAHGDALSRRMKELMATRTADEWMAIFKGFDVPASLVLTPAAGSRTPQMQAREMISERDGERHIPFPVHTNGRRGAALRWVAPPIGAHTRDVLTELGVAGAEIETLIEKGVVNAPATHAAKSSR